MTEGPTKQERREFAEAHAEGLHDDAPREFCPECEDQRRELHPAAAAYIARRLERQQDEREWRWARGDPN